MSVHSSLVKGNYVQFSVNSVYVNYNVLVDLTKPSI